MQTQPSEVNVLVVDDEPNNLLAYEVMSQGLDVNLVRAGSGAEALRYLIAHEAAVIFMDVNMPDMDGFETSALIRQRDQLRTTPMIFVTAAFRDDVSKIRGYAAGAVDYLEKPVVAEIFRSKVAVFAELFKKTEEVKNQALLIVEAQRQEHEKHHAEERLRWEAERLRADLATGKKHAEHLERNAEDIRQLNEALTRQNVNLEQTNRKLTEVNKEKEMFVYVAAHDLKSPLRAIDNLAQWIEDDVGETLADNSRQHFRTLRQRVNRLDALLDGLLEYSRVGRVQTEPEEIDTGALVKEIVALINVPELFTISVAPDLPKLHTPRVPLQLVFLNLIVNAIKHHNRRDGCVEVSARADGAMFEFTVADDGPGIAPQFHERIFGMFQTLKPRDQVEGIGMGLALVKKTVENHGGKISVESEVGRGTRFRFTWRR